MRGQPGFGTADADAAAAELNRASCGRRGRRERPSRAQRFAASQEKEKEADDDTTGRGRAPAGGAGAGARSAPPAPHATWFVVVYNDPFEGRARDTPSPPARGRGVPPGLAGGGGPGGRVRRRDGCAVCAPGFFGATCSARLEALRAEPRVDGNSFVVAAARSETHALRPGEFTFFSFEVACRGQDARVTLTKNASNTSDGFADVFGLAFAVRRGAVPALDAGEYIAGAAPRPAMTTRAS